MTSKVSPLLINEEFIAIQPSLVRALGGRVLQAMMVQYLHFWLRVSTNVHDGHTWVYNSFEEWADRLGISPDQARRSMKWLEDEGLVVSCKPNASKWDHKKWYRLDMARLDERAAQGPSPDPAISPDQCGDGAGSRSGDFAGSSSSTERTTERTTESLLSPSATAGQVTDDVNTSINNVNDSLSRETTGSAPMTQASCIAAEGDTGTTDSQGAKGDSTGRQVREVFDAWVSIMEKSPAKAKLNAARSNKIKARLKEGYSVEECIAAITHAKENPWMRGQNDRGTLYDDIVTILRDGGTLERHRDWSPPAKPISWDEKLRQAATEAMKVRTA